MINDIEKAKRRKLYREQITILEDYRANVKQAITKFGEGKHIYRLSDSWYTMQLQGNTTVNYEKITSEINELGKEIYSIGDELLGAINYEIRRIRGKVAALR